MVSCLLIDPNARERAHVQNLLETLGMDCVAAPQADATTLSQDVAANTDVIVMEASGLPTAKQILKQYEKRAAAGVTQSPKPVLIMYGRVAGTDVINESILNGVSEFLVQPFDLDLLRFKLAQAGVLPRKAA